MQFNASTWLLARDYTTHGHSQSSIVMRLTSCVDGSMMMIPGAKPNTAMWWSTQDHDENVVVSNKLQVYV
jgi:hypothetical protein